jgi:hypothetical protein
MEASAKAKKPPKTVEIFVNNRPVQVTGHEPTGAEVKHAAEVPDSFKLYDPEGTEIGEEARVPVKAREKFIAISGQDVS